MSYLRRKALEHSLEHSPVQSPVRGFTDDAPSRRGVLNIASGLIAASIVGAGINSAGVTPVQAHRARLVLSTVLWRPDDPAAPEGAGRLEITHEVHAHDALLAISRGMEENTAKPTRLELTDLAAKARLALMAQSGFRIFDRDAAPLSLDPIGAEVRGNYVFIYQEGLLTAAPERLMIENTLLRDVFKGQANHTNITVNKQTRTVVYNGVQNDDARPATPHAPHQGGGRYLVIFDDAVEQPREPSGE